MLKECIYKRKISLVSIDADKREYLRYLKRVKTDMVDGSIVALHNAVSHTHHMGNYLECVYERYKSVTIQADKADLTVSLIMYT